MLRAAHRQDSSTITLWASSGTLTSLADLREGLAVRVLGLGGRVEGRLPARDSVAGSGDRVRGTKKGEPALLNSDSVLSETQCNASYGARGAAESGKGRDMFVIFPEGSAAVEHRPNSG